MVVDAWGKVIARCHDTQDVCLAEIDLSLLAKRRRDIPIRNHKRYDLYALSPVTGPSSVPLDSAEYRFGPHPLKGSEIFYVTPGQTIAFVNIKPVVPGHVLVSPVRCAKHLANLTPAEVSDLFLAVQRVSSVVQKHFGASSVTIAVQDGPDAGQTVPHVHVHVMPRKPGDFEKNDDIYGKLEHHDDKDFFGEEPKRRTDAEMAKEALELRAYFN